MLDTSGSFAPVVEHAAPTPEEFMRTLLSIFPKGTMGWVAAFDSTERPQWSGKAVRPNRLPEFDGLNAYYSTAGFERGARSRRIDEMIGAAVIVVDDPTDKG